MNKIKGLIVVMFLAVCLSWGSSVQAANVIVVLDPGHGGAEAGARRTWGGVTYKEEEIVLKLSKYTKKELEKYAGVKVYMTRTTARTMSLEERVNYAASVNATVLISQHINSTAQEETTATGALVFGPSGNYRPSQASETRRISQAILAGLETVGMKNNGIVYNYSQTGNTYPNGKLADYYGIVRRSVLAGFPGMIVEHGFVSNPSDCTRFYGSNAKIKKMAVAEAKAIAQYYGLKHKNLAGWYSENGKWYYQNAEGERAVSGWLTLGNAKYYLDKNGYRVTGWKKISKKKYFFKSDGVMATGLLTLNGKMYWLHAKGYLRTGFFKTSGNIYRYSNPQGVLNTGWKKRKGRTYYFEKKTGMMLTSRWMKRGSNWYYLSPSGYVYRNTKVKISGKTYKFSKDGICENRGKLEVQ